MAVKSTNNLFTNAQIPDPKRFLKISLNWTVRPTSWARLGKARYFLVGYVRLGEAGWALIGLIETETETHASYTPWIQTFQVPYILFQQIRKSHPYLTLFFKVKIVSISLGTLVFSSKGCWITPPPPPPPHYHTVPPRGSCMNNMQWGTGLIPILNP